MSNQFKKAIIDDVTSTNLDPSLQTVLLDCFEYAMKTLAVTLVREAVFHTTDFATVEKRGCIGYTLRIIRVSLETGVSWHAELTKDTQRMEVIAHLE